MDKSTIIMVMIAVLWLALFFKELFNGIREAERKSNGKEKEIPITYDKTLQVFDDLINKLKQLDNFRGKEIVVDISAREGYSYIRVYARQESKNFFSSESLVDVKSFESSISAITDLYVSAILELNKYFYAECCKNCDNRLRFTKFCTALDKDIKTYDYCNLFSTHGERNDI